MFTVDKIYTAKNGNQTPIQISVAKIPKAEINKYILVNRLKCIKCKNSGQLPCCPPDALPFKDLPSRAHLFAICVTLNLAEYINTREEIKPRKHQPHAFQSHLYLMAARAITKAALNQIISDFPGEIGLYYGKCTRCQFKLYRRCTKDRYTFESVRLDQERLIKECISDSEDISTAVIGGIYTSDKNIIRNMQEILEGMF